jgi:hypothetical protein
MVDQKLQRKEVSKVKVEYKGLRLELSPWTIALLVATIVSLIHQALL